MGGKKGIKILCLVLLKIDSIWTGKLEISGKWFRKKQPRILFQRSPRQPAEGRLAAEAPKGPELGASWVSGKSCPKSRALFELKYRTFDSV